VPKITAMRNQFYPTPENESWLTKMESKGINKSSLLNLAIDMLKPRLNNINTSESAIVETLLKKTDEEQIPY